MAKKNHYEEMNDDENFTIEHLAGFVFLTLLVIMLLCGWLCSCSATEREVQSKISAGTITKVEPMTNRCLVKVRDLNDSVTYSDYFVPLINPFIVGQMIWIIVKR